MKIYLAVNEENAIYGWASTRSADSDIELEVDDNHPFLISNPFGFLYKNGELIKKSDEQIAKDDAAIEAKRPPTIEELKNENEKLKKKLEENEKYVALNLEENRKFAESVSADFQNFMDFFFSMM